MSSEDMLHWVDYPRKPILQCEADWEGINVDNPASGVGSPAVIVEGNKLKMIYHGGSHSYWCDDYAEATLQPDIMRLP